MSVPLRLVLALHNHQPVGNFDDVFEAAYQNSYRPFLDVFEPYEHLQISLHTSGSLIEWLDHHHPEYLDRLAALCEAGRVEIVGGPFYEPILTMIPPVDRRGQIEAYTNWLRSRLGAAVRGMWVPERVWEPALVSDLVDAGMQYTVLDDYHFKCAGLTDDDLFGYFLTEDNGRVFRVFPGSERLRYLVPFADPQETIDYLGEVHAAHPGSVIVFGDDGEKFGTWPGTHKHCYTDGWLRGFFDRLCENRHWIRCTTLAEAIDHTPPVGKIYLPEASYREMTEWALPTRRLIQYEQALAQAADDPRLTALRPFIRGGFWRNFKVKYPESNEMYARMMQISRELQAALAQHPDHPQLQEARRDLFRGQCNCPYWHGAFGGIYLPHLRHAVYHHLIVADNRLQQLAHGTSPWVEARADDYNFDDRPEIQMANDRLAAFFIPSRGGHLYELDIRSIGHNLLATLNRRPEAYHLKVARGASHADDGVASIHERVIFRQEGLEERLQYDNYPRKSLVDHFYDQEVGLDAVAASSAEERGDFVESSYEARLRRAPQKTQLVLLRRGKAWALEPTIRKTITLEAGQPTLRIVYELSGLPTDGRVHFSTEFNFAGLPAGADDRYYFDAEQRRLGHLGTQLDLHDVQSLGLADDWRGVAVELKFWRPSHVWTYPIETVSQSEGGFELVHQSTVVQPHWYIDADEEGRWSVAIDLTIDTAQAERRSAQAATATAG